MNGHLDVPIMARGNSLVVCAERARPCLVRCMITMTIN